MHLKIFWAALCTTPAVAGIQLLGVTGLAAHSQEAFLQSAALQVGVELHLDVPWKRPANLGAQLTNAG
jgi:hypothetical protein